MLILFLNLREKITDTYSKSKSYDLTELIPEKALPRHIQFVWRGINERDNLRQFLSSDFGWG